MVEIMKEMQSCNSSMESKAQSGTAALAQLGTVASAEVCSIHRHREVEVSSMYRLAVVVEGCGSRYEEMVEVDNWQWWGAAAAKVCCKGCHRLST